MILFQFMLNTLSSFQKERKSFIQRRIRTCSCMPKECMRCLFSWNCVCSVFSIENGHWFDPKCCANAIHEKHNQTVIWHNCDNPPIYSNPQLKYVMYNILWRDVISCWSDRMVFPSIDLIKLNLKCIFTGGPTNPFIKWYFCWLISHFSIRKWHKNRTTVDVYCPQSTVHSSPIAHKYIYDC